MANLIYHAGALGDFITTLPAISRWRKDRGAEPSVLLGKPAHAALAAPPFDQTWDAEAAACAGLFSGRLPDDSPLAAKLRSVTSALLFTAASSPLPESLARAGVKEIVRQDPFPSSVIHVIDYHLSIFRGADPGEQRIPRILLPAIEPWDVAAFHPGSGSAKKNWPLERYRELAARLEEHGRRVAWILGPAENGMEPPTRGDRWSSLPLPVLAARLAGCRLYVGNDSGVTHLAAAAGCPTVALFGESDPRVWAPRGDRVNVVGADSMKAILVRDVLNACVDFLKER